MADASLETHGAPDGMGVVFDLEACSLIVHRGPMGERLCNIDGCTNLHRRRGLCHKHYKRWARWGDPNKVHPRYIRRAQPKPRPPAQPKPRAKRRRHRMPPMPKPWANQLPTWVDLDRIAGGPRDHWGERAHCKGHDPGPYFPASNTGSIYTEPLETCARCPVRHDCLAAHLDEVHGCFATTPAQRVHVRRALAQRAAA